MEVQVIIDGKKLTADSNETILQVARRNGIEIPTLCYLKDVNEPASCRVCVVEVEGRHCLYICVRPLYMFCQATLPKPHGIYPR